VRNPGLPGGLPIQDYLLGYFRRNPASFHTPGHKGSPPALLDFSSNPLVLDVPDDVCGFPGAREESQAMAAYIYGTRRTYYLVNGSTAGVKAMFLACLCPGDKVLIGRNLHMSVVSALVETGVHPVFVPVAFDGEGIPLNVTPAAVEKAASEHPDARALFVTSPSYFGVCADLPALGEIARRYGMFFLVDEAWGAHFPFGRSFPPSSLQAGADMAVHGAHKTLPVLTGAALLHVAPGRVDPARVETALSMVETSSPNVLFYLSLEAAISRMHREGASILHRAAQRAAGAARAAGEMGCAFGAGLDGRGDFQADPLKVLLRTRPHVTGVSGYRAAAELTHGHGVVPEMADLSTVLFIFTGFESEEDCDRLHTGLSGLSRLCKEAAGQEGRSSASFPLPPGAPLTPRDAFFSRGEAVSLKTSPGRTARSAVVPYPPGIPVLLPGEEITRESVEYLERVMEKGGVVRGLQLSGDEPLMDAVAG